MDKSKQDKIAKSKYSYKNKNVYIGLDVHKATYYLTARCDGMLIKRCVLPADPETLVEFIREKFSGAHIFSAYEAGFCGFYLHRFLLSVGIKNIVVNPASIEVSARDRVKTDKRDSMKIATQLEAGRLRCVNIPSEKQEARREVTRLRESLVRKKHETGCQISSCFDRHQEVKWVKKRVMSRKLIEEILTLDLSTEMRLVVEILVKLWISLADQIKEIEKKT